MNNISHWQYNTTIKSTADLPVSSQAVPYMHQKCHNKSYYATQFTNKTTDLLASSQARPYAPEMPLTTLNIPHCVVICTHHPPVLCNIVLICTNHPPCCAMLYSSTVLCNDIAMICAHHLAPCCAMLYSPPVLWHIVLISCSVAL